jgi:hypothetical protein
VQGVLAGPPIRLSLPDPPKIRAPGSDPLVSSKRMVSLPPSPNTLIDLVLNTVGKPPGRPPASGTSPFLLMTPIASRLISIELSKLSPNTVSVPNPGLNTAVTAGTFLSSKDWTAGRNRVARVRPTGPSSDASQKDSRVVAQFRDISP